VGRNGVTSWGTSEGLIEFADVPMFQLGTGPSVLFLNVTDVTEQKRLHQARTQMHVEVIISWDSSVGIVTFYRIDYRDSILGRAGKFPFTASVCIRCQY
jgi:hypothetical protein